MQILEAFKDKGDFKLIEFSGMEDSFGGWDDQVLYCLVLYCLVLYCTLNVLY